MSSAAASLVDDKVSPKERLAELFEQIAELTGQRNAIDAQIVDIVCPYHHRLHHAGGITLTGPAHQLVVTDADGQVLTNASLARPPTQPPPAVAPYRGPTGERADWWWYTPFQPQPPPRN